MDWRWCVLELGFSYARLACRLSLLAQGATPLSHNSPNMESLRVDIRVNVMLPDSYYLPSERDQSLGHFFVPIAVAPQFLLPEPSIGFRHDPVLRAVMPKAPIDKHRHLCRMKHDVWSPRQLLTMETVSKSLCPQSVPQRQLRPSLLPSNARHQLAPSAFWHSIRH